MGTKRPKPTGLAPYVPRVALLWDQLGEDRPWRALDGSLVFVDISGFTALSEKLAKRGRVGAEELTDTLSRCFGDLLAVAYDAGGSLLKFGGDALLLLFEGDGHEARACATALAMQSTMRVVGRVSTSVGAFRLRMSVGVHSGPLHLFRVGRTHRELIVTGPGATETVVMEGAADAGEIVVSPSTADRIDPACVGARKGPGYLLRATSAPLPSGLATQPVRALSTAADWIPVAVREELLAGQIESQHRHVSIAFVHFDDVDHLLASDGPAAVADALDELVQVVQAAAEEQGVTFLASDVDRDGGKLILVAGAPRALGDDEGRMLRALRRVSDAHVPLPIRIGVNRGHAFVGEVGPAFRRTYTVMGDAVNLAARLMAKAAPGQVLSTSDVLDRAATAFEASPLEPFHVKGKSLPVSAFALGEQGERRVDPAATRTPLVGRGDELAALDRLVANVRTGHGGLVDVSGAAGVGKSRVLAELVAGAADVTAVRAFCEPHEVNTPYYAFRFVLRRLLGVTAGGRDGGRQLERAVGTADRSLLPWLPLIAAVVDVEVDTTAEVTELEPRYRPARTRAIVVELLAAAVTRPVIVVIEDAQWLDSMSGSLLAAVAGRASEHPWLLCVARRVEANADASSDGWLDGAPVTLPLRLAPLSDAEAQSLVVSAGGASLLPHEREALIRTSGGNPLFLTELVRAHGRRGADEPVPDTLDAVVATEIDRLPPADRRLLRYMSVFGTMIDVELLADVTGGAVRTAAAASRRFGTFLEPAGPGLLRFRNQCYRQVAYDALPFAVRRELHAAVGEALERAKGTGDTDRAGTLSFHFFHARRYDRCWTYARQAAAGAEAKYAIVAAAALYERALSAASRVDGVDRHDVACTWESLGDVAILAGDFGRARTAFARARALRKGDVRAVADLCGKEYRAAVHLRQPGASRWLQRGMRMLEGEEGTDELAVRARLRGLFAHSRLESGRPREALRWAQLAADDARRSGHRRALADACLVQDWALTALGRGSEATSSELALAICEELGAVGLMGTTLAYMGNMAYFGGRWDEAIASWSRSSDLFRRAGNTVDAAHGAGNTAEVLVFQGRLDEAEARIAETLDVWRSMGYGIGVATALNNQARLAFHRGDVDGASAVFSEAKKACGASVDAPAHIEADAWLAECLLRQGRPADALELVDATIKREAATGDSTMAPMLHRLRGCALASLGRVNEAWPAFDQSTAIAGARGAAYEMALTLDAVAAVAGRPGLPPDQAAVDERDRLLSGLGVRSTRRPPLVEQPSTATVAVVDTITADLTMVEAPQRIG